MLDEFLPALGIAETRVAQGPEEIVTRFDGGDGGVEGGAEEEGGVRLGCWGSGGG